jgi:hypothetical protein
LVLTLVFRTESATRKPHKSCSLAEYCLLDGAAKLLTPQYTGWGRIVRVEAAAL